MALGGLRRFAGDALSAIESYYYSSPCNHTMQHTRGVASRQRRDCENVNGTLIKQSESICNYSGHRHIMEKAHMRTALFDSLVVSLWIFFFPHLAFMSFSLQLSLMQQLI